MLQKLALLFTSKNQQLIDACAYGSLETVQQLLQAKADPNFRNSVGDSPLVKAAYRKKSSPILKALFDAKAKPNHFYTERGGYALNWGRYLTPFDDPDDFSNKLEILVQYRADPNFNYNGMALLPEAVRLNKPTLVKKILESKADINNDINRSALLLASSNPFDEIAAMLSTQKLDLKHFPTALESNQPKAVRVLLDNKADANALHGGMTPLYIAIKNASHETVEMLLEAKADPKLPNISGSTPLYSAVLMGDTQLIKTLCRAKADPNELNEREQNLLHVAIDFDKRAPVVEALLEAKANPNKLDKKLTSPFFMAAASKRVELVACFLQDKDFVASLPPKSQWSKSQQQIINNNQQIKTLVDSVIQRRSSLTVLGALHERTGGKSFLYHSLRKNHPINDHHTLITLFRVAGSASPQKKISSVADTIDPVAPRSI